MNDNSNQQIFTEEVARKIGNYVYRLIDPRNGETFYVGRGRGNRVFQHAQGVQIGMDKDGLSDKLDRIREIKNAGLEVIHIIHRHAIPDDTVSDVEAALIDAYPGLTNEQGGEGSSSYGPMHADEIIRLYALPIMDEKPEHKLVLINVNNITDRSSKEAVYNQVKGNWRISVDRARQADYVIAVLRGVAIGIFKSNKWLESVAHEGRYCFEGEAADDKIWDKYIGAFGKRIANDEMKHIQNPIRYWNC